MPIINKRVPSNAPVLNFNVPDFRTPDFPTNDPNEQYYNWENDEYELYNSDADAAGCYEHPEDWDSDDFEALDELEITERKISPEEKKYHDEATASMSPQEKHIYWEHQHQVNPELDPSKKALQNPDCTNDFNCVDCCHCYSAKNVCFYCKLVALGLSIKTTGAPTFKDFLDDPKNQPKPDII